jgi:HlyD family secretion protein
VTQLGSPAVTNGHDQSTGKPAGGSRLIRRRNVLIGTGLAAALLAAGGLIGAAFVKSPQQLAADTAPPQPTTTTAKVISRVLTSSVQMRGLVYPSTEYDVYATPPETTSSSSASSGSGAPGDTGSAPAYITRLNVTTGSTVRNGRQLAAIDGEPLFALKGSVPAWRDLLPGDSGPDVAELQKSLGTLGYYFGGDTPGFFGGATQSAVSLYYEHLGYTPPSTGGVPVTDVVFLASLPATVVAVNGAKGDQAGQPFLEIAPRGSLALTGELAPAYAGQVKSGLKVRIYDEVTGIHTTGTVTGLLPATTSTPAGAIVDIGINPAAAGPAGSGSSSGSASSGSSGAGSAATPFVPLSVRPSKPLAAALNGENVLVTVETGHTEGPVLSVPVAAIVTTAFGRSYVTVVGTAGKKTEVTVTPGISENGYVQVTPARAGMLTAGDNVVVSG